MKEREWVSVKERLPTDDKSFVLFAKWYPAWNRWLAAEAMLWSEIKNFRQWELKNEYTHWLPLKPEPPTK